MFLSYSRSSKLYFLMESVSLVNKVSSLNSHSACCWKFRKIFSLRASSPVMEPIIYGKPKVPTASWILEKVLKFARQFSKPWKNLLCKWIFLRFGKILFDFTCKFATPSWKKLCSCVFKVSIDHLFDNLESGKNLEFGIQYLYEPWKP